MRQTYAYVRYEISKTQAEVTSKSQLQNIMCGGERRNDWCVLKEEDAKEDGSLVKSSEEDMGHLSMKMRTTSLPEGSQ